ncbi:MAG: hypothetical protein A2445_00155 [Candidatus Jacksonbacteria bacterium RIFOXYC2_FULL_44_29]|nr:MAG: Imidazoleglycerol-phosphate dehydratase [Parcubacteria group bacterium GW2011_GWA2_42_28]KKT54705.1 MAG: Imidazoleglycerol-phosphate dehydratase [Parcubacteria group bacterium GW2011_GWC2_44_22]OGY75304.1 MAG: hypothetical protein A2240_01665 [Candidatus Jacksonbacteria bacterium RIFOXYA2_FULL_43_12]OGY76214.1 MAG: hypothetical protein A2295_05750 [Candidatus Jacksonbacteria bacterium RIFOXYB2_FULL_44_15]OGY78069.1 MAG: hypothetical protein A2445_00155 [Candidatus Jacksonbacteria bacter
MNAYKITTSDQTKVTVTRTTAESAINVTVEAPWLDKQIQPRAGVWQTGIKFLNHMIQLICRRGGMNIDAAYKCQLESTYCQHVVWEDVGLVFGAALNELLTNRRKAGVEGAGEGVACIDEALTRCYLSFEGRSGCYLNIADSDASQRELVEDAKCQDVRQFFEGFTQGARCTLQLELGPAMDTHHLWESAFRAFGEALRASLQANPWRKGVIVGVKDTKD